MYININCVSCLRDWSLDVRGGDGYWLFFFYIQVRFIFFPYGMKIMLLILSTHNFTIICCWKLQGHKIYIFFYIFKVNYLFSIYFRRKHSPSYSLKVGCSINDMKIVKFINFLVINLLVYVKYNINMF